MQKNLFSKWERLLFSNLLVGKNASHKIAYIGLVTAFVVVANIFFEFKLADTQFSLTLAVSVVAGILLGPVFGFVACFLGDLVGFLYNSAGFVYMPWIGADRLDCRLYHAGCFRTLHLVFVCKNCVDCPLELFHLYNWHQHNGVLVALF